MENYYNFNTVTSFIMTDNQILLSKALQNRNIIKFREALRNGANALGKYYLCPQYNVFETALQTAGCSEYVRECLRSGCKANYVNTLHDKTAIYFACDSRDPRILNEVLSLFDAYIDHKYNDLTPLNSLAKCLNNENVNDVLQCMKLLLAFGASPNIPDQQEMTPLHSVIENTELNSVDKLKIIKMFLANDVDIDTFRSGELRNIFRTKYPLLRLPKRKSPLESLKSYLNAGNMHLFQIWYLKGFADISEDDKLDLFLLTIQIGAHEGFDLILKKGVNYNKEIGDIPPIRKACMYVNTYALEKLLQLPDIEICPYLLRYLVRCIHIIKFKNFSASQSYFISRNYIHCFDLLLDSVKTDINFTDSKKSTILHYAVKFNEDELVEKLLRKGASISLNNNIDELPLNGMSTKVLEEHLDNCISSSAHKLGDENYEIIISFKNFMISQNDHKLREVLPPIKYMAESPEHRYLLQHPVIISLLYLKWQKLSLVFFINFFLYMFFVCSILTLAVLKFRDIDNETAKRISLYCSWLGIGFLILRELIQLLMSPLKYFTYISNYLEIILIILSILTCYYNDLDLELQRNITVSCILLLAYELFSLVGSLPISSISTHMLMLEAVCKTFVKSFLLYSIFIFTFTLCFYIKNDIRFFTNTEVLFNNITSPLMAFSKTIVMLTGEFDDNSSQLNSTFSTLLFLFFVFFMTIILFNLLNGLAVSDTQAIRSQAELNAIICRINLLSRYEQITFKRPSQPSFLLKRQPFRLIFKIIGRIIPNYTTDVQMSLFPNNHNKFIRPKTKGILSGVKVIHTDKDRNVVVPLWKSDNAIMEYENENVNCWFSWLNKCSQIDRQLVRKSMEILNKKSSKSKKCPSHVMNEKLNIILEKLSLQND